MRVCARASFVSTTKKHCTFPSYNFALRQSYSHFHRKTNIAYYRLPSRKLDEFSRETNHHPQITGLVLKRWASTCLNANQYLTTSFVAVYSDWSAKPCSRSSKTTIRYMKKLGKVNVSWYIITLEYFTLISLIILMLGCLMVYKILDFIIFHINVIVCA